jgi:hypothetical protein
VQALSTKFRAQAKASGLEPSSICSRLTVAGLARAAGLPTATELVHRGEKRELRAEGLLPWLGKGGGEPQPSWAPALQPYRFWRSLRADLWMEKSLAGGAPMTKDERSGMGERLASYMRPGTMAGPLLRLRAHRGREKSHDSFPSVCRMAKR